MTTPVQIDWRNLYEAINPVYRPYLRDETPLALFMGGAGSGKSWFASQKVVYRCITEEPFDAAVVRKIARTNRSTTYKQLKATIKQMGVSSLFNMTVSPMEMTYIPNGNTIGFYGLQHEEDVEKLKGVVNLRCIWAEEPTELSATDFNNLRLRMRGATEYYKQILCTFNPITARNYLKKMFWDKPVDPARVSKLVTTYKDNLYVDAEDVTVLEELADIDPQLHAIYALAQWGVLTGLIYEHPEMVEALPSVYEDRCFGVDWGFVNPTAVIEVRLKDSEPWLHQIIYEAGLTTRDTINQLDELQLPKDAAWYCDSAEPDRIAEMRAAGYNAHPCPKGPGSVKAGIDFVRSQTLRLTVDSIETASEFDSYKWRVNAAGDPMDESVKYNDHAMDAVRYLLWAHVGKRPEPEPYEEIITGSLADYLGDEGDVLGDLY